MMQNVPDPLPPQDLILRLSNRDVQVLVGLNALWSTLCALTAHRCDPGVCTANLAAPSRLFRDEYSAYEANALMAQLQMLLPAGSTVDMQIVRDPHTPQ